MVQILLVVILSIPPSPRRRYLRLYSSLVPLLIRLSRHLPRDCFLLWRVKVDRAPVLRTYVRTLPVGGRGVVHAVEELEELAVGDLRWVVVDLQGFGV